MLGLFIGSPTMGTTLAHLVPSTRLLHAAQLERDDCSLATVKWVILKQPR